MKVLTLEDVGLADLSSYSPSQIQILKRLVEKHKVLNFDISKGKLLILDLKRRSSKFPFGRYWYGRRGAVNYYELFTNYDFDGKFGWGSVGTFDVSLNRYI